MVRNAALNDAAFLFLTPANPKMAEKALLACHEP
jgi:hypothetical protein